MENKDIILKYLADMMTDKEKSDFEKKLSQSEDLKNELKRYQNSLMEVSSLADIKEESPYFQNLLPRVRTRLDKEKKLKWVPKLAYLATTATAILLIAINIGKFGPDKVEQVKKDVAAETKTAENQDIQDIYENYSIASGVEIVETARIQSNVSFDVNVSEVAEKESIQEIVNTRIAYPLEDYLLALR